MEDDQEAGKAGQEVLSAAQGRMIEALLQGRTGNGPVGVEVLEGVTDEICRTITRRDESSEVIKAGEDMRSALVSSGLTVAHLANVLREGLACRKHVVVKGVTRKLPDYALRLKYLELAHRLRGDLTAKAPDAGTVTYEERIRRIMRTVDNPVDK